MTKYDFLKLHRPDLVCDMNQMCPSEIGLPDSKWKRDSKRCPGCNLACVGCWIYTASDEEIEAAEKFITDQGMTYKQFVELHYPDAINENARGGVVGCPKDYGLVNRCEFTATGNTDCLSCWNTRMDHKTYYDAIRYLVAHKEEKGEMEDRVTAIKTNIPKKSPVKQSSDDPAVHRPSHYEFSKYRPIKVIREWGLNFTLGSAVKYIVRAGKKDPAKHVQDLEKAVEYLRSEIEDLKEEQGANV